MGDEEFAQRYREWCEGGSQALEQELWTGTHYMLYHEPETESRSDVSVGYQLDGEWISRIHGLDGVFRPDRARKTLQTLADINANPELCDFEPFSLRTPAGDWSRTTQPATGPRPARTCCPS